MPVVVVSDPGVFVLGSGILRSVVAEPGAKLLAEREFS
jgi:hypothetical protein